MGRGTFYFDAATFENAVAVFTNSGLTNCAPDGYYSDGTNVRRQVNCVLLALEACPDCTAETPTPTATPTQTPTPTAATPTPTVTFATPTPTAGTPTPTAATPSPVPPTPTPTSVPSGFYYELEPCLTPGGVVVDACYIYETAAPLAYQQYLNSNNGLYYYYNIDTSSVIITVQAVAAGNRYFVDGTQQSNINLIPGATY